MDSDNDRGKNIQKSQEPSRKKLCSSMDKGKGKLFAREHNDNDYNNIQFQFPNIFSNLTEALSLSPSSPMMFDYNQNQRPSSIGNSRSTSLTMHPPTYNDSIPPPSPIQPNQQLNQRPLPVTMDPSTYYNYMSSSPSKLFDQQQNQRPLPVGNTGFTPVTMDPSTYYYYKSLSSSKLLDEHHNQRSLHVGNTNSTPFRMDPPTYNNFISSNNNLFSQTKEPSRIPTPHSMEPPIYSKCKTDISEYLYSNNIDPNVVESPSFQELLNIGGKGSQLQSSVPTVNDLREGMLSKKFHEIQTWVENIKKSWPLTGCSVILEGWTDEIKGRKLMNVLVDCPMGTVYLQSLDVSKEFGDVYAMENVIEQVIKEIGPKNVLQVLSYASSPWLNGVGLRIEARHESIFWSCSATYCLTMILERVASLRWVEETIEQAKKITRLVHSNPSILGLLENYYLVKSSKIKAVAPFLTLENILMKKMNLRTIFSSRKWKRSRLGSSSSGKNVAKLVMNNKSFWNKVALVVKGSIPIVNVLRLMNDGNSDKDKPHMGIIYETMDQLKETISDEINVEGVKGEFWSIIDEIWNHILHSPLHAAGYFFNPKLFDAQDLVNDHEVASGIWAVVGKYGGDQQTKNLVYQQLRLYQDSKGDFEGGKEEINNFSPDKWWRRFGNHCPELQKLALKVLGLSCNGASSYELKRDVAEKTLSVKETHPSYQKLKEYSFVSYNLHLRELKNSGKKFNIEAHELDPCDDWIVGDY
ncbi:unnamed protein product [Amaranthus hypochondriacus]